MRCQHCQRRFCPAKPLLACVRRGQVAPALAQAACLAGSSWPYRQAAEILARLSGARIGAETMRLLVNAQGQRLAERQQQAQGSEPHDPTPQMVPSATPCAPEERLIIGLDGGWVPSRDQRGGMEGKVAVLVTGKQVLREASEPAKDLTWVELERWVQRHRHPSVIRSRYRSHWYAATFAAARDPGGAGQQGRGTSRQQRPGTGGGG